MTLSIAAKYPWGELRKLSAFQGDLPQAIIFATDSRWTKYYPNNQHDFEDVGTKFFDLTDDSGAVYAGDVQSGEHCIKELKTKLKSNRKRSFKSSMYTAQQTFQRVYKYHIRTRKKKVFPLWFLIGVCDKAGNANLMSFSSPKFNPIFVEGICGIGVRKAYKDFEKTLNDEIEKVVKEEFDTRSKFPALQKLQAPINANAETIGMLIAGVMHQQIIGNAGYYTIGGPIQFAIIDREGINMPGLRWTKDPTNDGGPWLRATAEPGEITTYQDKYKLGPDFINISSFGLYQINF